MKIFAYLLLFFGALQGAHAAQDNLEFPAISTTSISNSIADLSAQSREQALATESLHYSLPRENMSYFEMGGYSQRSNARLTPNQGSEAKASLTSQGLYFNHSRGIFETFALDFSLNYAWPEPSAADQYSGINSFGLGARSLFEGLGLTWVYGASATYLPNGELLESNSKTALSAQIGFEERVDIARWGMQTQVSSQNTLFAREQFNLIGFFEIPFVTRLKMGASAGADLRSLGGSDQSNFARIYGRFSLDKVSDAQIALSQTNDQNENIRRSDAEISLAMTRVF